MRSLRMRKRSVSRNSPLTKRTACDCEVLRMHEHKSFGKFGDSLLSKAAKLAEVLAELEGFVEEGSKKSEQKRLAQSIRGLEEAIACLNAEHENVEAQKVNSQELADKLLAKMKEQVRTLLKALTKAAEEKVHLAQSATQLLIKCADGSWKPNPSSESGDDTAGHLLNELASMVGSGAVCKHTLKVAQAAVKDNPNSQSSALLQFAAVRSKDAESGAHRIFRQHGLAVNVTIDRLDLGNAPVLKSFPFIKLSSWVTYLLDHNLLHKLTGIQDELYMGEVLVEFWARYRALFPQHDLWNHSDIDLSRAIPVYTHTDEGRTYKKRPLLVFSTHGCLGLGTQPQHRAQADDHMVDGQDIPLEDSEMNMNFIGNTWSTHFIHASLLKSVSDDEPQAIPGMMKEYAADLQTLYNVGGTDSRGQRRVWIVHCGTKGDLLALSKLGSFTRDYTRMPRAGQSKQLAVGICHLCQAGREFEDPAGNVPFEDVSSRARWHASMHQEYPWQQMPPILEGVPRNAPGEEAAFFCLDLWHCWHYGLAKVFVPSVLLVFQETLIPGSSIDKRLEWINDDWKAYCRSHKFAAHAIDINKDTLGYSGSNFPAGHWNKGAISATLMYYLEFLCTFLGVDSTAVNPLHREIVACVYFVVLASFHKSLLCFFTHVYAHNSCSKHP
ncbi:unnamed protein product [Symbiodinium sp. CCMP2456]|nr:unnamed protein product [Symbiodinium sp. CCMP2456]